MIKEVEMLWEFWLIVGVMILLFVIGCILCRCMCGKTSKKEENYNNNNNNNNSVPSYERLVTVNDDANNIQLAEAIPKTSTDHFDI